MTKQVTNIPVSRKRKYTTFSLKEHSSYVLTFLSYDLGPRPHGNPGSTSIRSPRRPSDDVPIISLAEEERRCDGASGGRSD